METREEILKALHDAQFSKTSTSAGINSARLARLGRAATAAGVAYEAVRSEPLNKGDPSNEFEQRRSMVEDNTKKVSVSNKAVDTLGVLENTKNSLSGNQLAVTPDQLSPVVPDQKTETASQTLPIDPNSGVAAADALNKSPDARKKIISNFKKVSGQRLRAKDEATVEAYLANPELLAKKQESENPGVAAAFTTALLGFLPVLVGAAFGGDEGGAAGAQVGLGAIKQLADEKQKEFENTQAVEKTKLEALKETNQNVRFDITQNYNERKLDFEMMEKRADLAIRNRLASLEEEKIKQAGSAEPKLSEFELKNRQFASTASYADQALDESFKKIPREEFNSFWKATMLSAGRKTGSQFFVPDKFQPFYTASKQFIEPVVRSLTGTGMREDEAISVAEQFIPVADDTDTQLLQKKYGRALMVEGMATTGKTGMPAHEFANISNIASDIVKNNGLPSPGMWSKMSPLQKRWYAKTIGVK